TSRVSYQRRCAPSNSGLSWVSSLAHLSRLWPRSCRTGGNAGKKRKALGLRWLLRFAPSQLLLPIVFTLTDYRGTSLRLSGCNTHTYTKCELQWITTLCSEATVKRSDFYPQTYRKVSCGFTILCHQPLRTSGC